MRVGLISSLPPLSQECLCNLPPHRLYVHAYGFRSLAFFAAFFSLQKLSSRGTDLDIVSVPPRLSFSDVRKADYSKQWLCVFLLVCLYHGDIIYLLTSSFRTLRFYEKLTDSFFYLFKMLFPMPRIPFPSIEWRVVLLLHTVSGNF
jgi:hypothetical protein